MVKHKKCLISEKHRRGSSYNAWECRLRKPRGILRCAVIIVICYILCLAHIGRLRKLLSGVALKSCFSQD